MRSSVKINQATLLIKVNTDPDYQLDPSTDEVATMTNPGDFDVDILQLAYSSLPNMGGYDGDAYIHTQAIDQAGNTGDQHRYHFKFDNIRPEITNIRMLESSDGGLNFVDGDSMKLCLIFSEDDVNPSTGAVILGNLTNDSVTYNANYETSPGTCAEGEVGPFVVASSAIKKSHDTGVGGLQIVGFNDAFKDISDSTVLFNEEKNIVTNLENAVSTLNLSNVIIDTPPTEVTAEGFLSQLGECSCAGRNI